MDVERIAELVAPYLTSEQLAAPAALDAQKIRQIAAYLDLLLRWNARVNLTAVREPEEIIRRHFGESLFLAACLFAVGARGGQPVAPKVVDLGSGAGFPGLPIRIYVPDARVTLVESNHKKVAFLREVIRALNLTAADVFAGRGEELLATAAKVEDRGSAGSIVPKSEHAGFPPDVVTMRAVEKFESALPLAARLARISGGHSRLALLIGAAQIAKASELAREFRWNEPIPVPESRERVVLIGEYHGQPEPRM